MVSDEYNTQLCSAAARLLSPKFRGLFVPVLDTLASPAETAEPIDVPLRMRIRR